MSKDARNIQARIRTRRTYLDITQEELAKKTGLTGMAISHFENGRRIPSVQNLIKLAAGLMLSLDELVTRV